MAELDVLGLGVAVRDVTVLLDTFPTPDEKYRAKGFYESSGGPVPTALVTLARLGRRVSFRGIVGNDAVGEFIIDDLRREGVDVSRVVRKKDLTSPSSVILVEGGRRTIFEGWQTDLPLSSSDVNFDSCRALLVDARLPDVQIDWATRAREAGITVVLDCGHPRPGVENVLGLTDIAILSHTYPRTVVGENYDAAKFLAEIQGQLPPDGRRIAGLTLGPEGCVIRTPDKPTLWIPGHKIEAIDSTGAGDVFHGGFIHSMLADEPPDVSARFANAAAALKCRGMTGRAPIPSEKEIRDFAGI